MIPQFARVYVNTEGIVAVYTNKEGKPPEENPVTISGDDVSQYDLAITPQHGETGHFHQRTIRDSLSLNISEAGVRYLASTVNTMRVEPWSDD